MTADITDTSVERALRTWTRRHSGTWTRTDETELQAWLAAAPEHRTAYDRVARLWADTGQLRGRFRHSETPLVREAPTRRAPRRVLVAASIAALVVALAIPLWRVGSRWWSGVPVHWETQRGETKALHLEDGTQILLDADSELVVRLGARERHVLLKRGEALFTVVHDVSRPFEVEVGHGRVTDLGTRFDVETLQGSARISVLQGRVGIFTPHGQELLVAGRGGGYDSEGALLPLREIDDSVALWQDGQRHFDAEPLSDVVARLTRYHDVTFVFSDPRLKQLRVSGTFRIGDLPLFLRTLSAALPIETRWAGSQRVEIKPRT